MSLKCTVAFFKLILASTFLLLALPQAGRAQAPPALIITDEAMEQLEEIIVVGEPTLRFLREDVYRTENRFYELFNTLNEGKQFDIHCVYKQPIGSHIRRRVCEANFVKSEYMPPTIARFGGMLSSESGVQSLSNFGSGNSGHQLAFVQHKTRQMQKLMAELVAEHPELHAALLEFADAKSTYDSAIRDRCAEQSSLCEQ